MILVDSNIWLALALSMHEFHGVSREWAAHQKPANALLFCRATQQSFLRLVTTRAVLAPYGIAPLSNKAAWMAYEQFYTSRPVAWAEEPKALETHWKHSAANLSTSSPKVWMDAFLAAFALAGGYQLVTTDKAFKQFKGLDLVVIS